MDNYRFILFVALAFILVMIYQAWEEQNRPATPTSTSTSVPRSPTAPSAFTDRAVFAKRRRCTVRS